MTTERTLKWVVCEMDQGMKSDVELSVNKALDNGLDIEAEISKHVKGFFDNKYGPNWHCVVGKNFASYGSYSSKHYVFLYVGQMAILLYKL